MLTRVQLKLAAYKGAKYWVYWDKFKHSWKTL